MMKLAVTTYNRPDMTRESYERVSGLVDVIVVDDASDMMPDCPGATLYVNDKNLGPFRNKLRAAGLCDDWCILLDSDNIIDKDYLDVVGSLELDPDTIYMPQQLRAGNVVLWDYKDFLGVTFDKDNIDTERNLFTTCFNTGNFVVHGPTYVEVAKNYDNEFILADSMYFTYLWLKAGKKMRVVDGLGYIHRVHPGSWYKNNQSQYSALVNRLIQMIKEL